MLHTLGYCRPVAHKTGERETSEITVKLVPKSPVDVHRRLLPEVTVMDPVFPQWLLFVLVDFDGAVVSFRVRPRLGMDDARLSARTLKQFPLHLYARAAHESTTGLMRQWAPDPEAEPAAAAEFAVLDRQLDLKRPGRAGRPDIEYAQVAARYIARLGSGTPLKDLARELHYSESQVRSLLNEARRKELLTKAPPGTAGGSLTEKAEQLLRGRS